MRRHQPWIAAAVFSLATAGAALGQWDVRTTVDYRVSHFGAQEYRMTTQEILARRLIQLTETRRLQILGLIERSEDLEANDHLFQGRIEGIMTSPTLDMSLRYRPDQRRLVTLPDSWRHEELVYGGSWRPTSATQFRFDHSDRKQTYGSYLSGDIIGDEREGTTEDTRFALLQRVGWLDLDAVHRRSVQETESQNAMRARTNETAFGAHGNRSFFRNVLNADATVRHAFTTRERTNQLDQRDRYDAADVRGSYTPSRKLAFNAVLGWQETLRHTSAADRLDRNVEISGDATVRPTLGSSFSVIRSFQERRSPNAHDEVDYMRAQAQVAGRVLPELRASVGLARNWVLARQGSASPSDQLNVTLAGAPRRGAELSVSWLGQRLESLPGAARFSVAQSAELRLIPLRAFHARLSAEASGRSSSFDPWKMDRASYRAEVTRSFFGASSINLSYASQWLADGRSPEKYSLGCSVALNARWLNVSGNVQAARSSATTNDARDWGVSSSVSTSLRTRVSELSVSHSRILPAIGTGGHSWAAELKRRFR